MEKLSPIIDKVVPLRHELHEHPELSGQEINTADAILNFLKPTQPDHIHTNVGGHGIIMTYESGKPGPHLMFRAELDALRIEEKNDIAYKSRFSERGHLCGHDGHMSILAGLGFYLSESRPAYGKVSLLYQPAEETGEGGSQVIESDAWQEQKPDYLFALHNLPGFPLNKLLLKPGIFAAASQGMKTILRGKTAHAARPEQAKSPALALSHIIQDLHDFKSANTEYDDFVLLTVVHAVLGTPSYGITPGLAELGVTLRSFRNEDMTTLQHWAESVISRWANSEGLTYDFQYSEVFPATINHPEAYQFLTDAVAGLDVSSEVLDTPFRWSEDFGYYTRDCKTCFFGLGAGRDTPDLHHENYDFPDEIIATGLQVFTAIIKNILG
ncbi:amidohydrolase [Catalinimonas alkaloidigena]|uniref:amidohydrolase n=1 Tax=Catalinimonas alkaloidigena TaxID=1075417 RepID=UPI002406741C|nr:amidohydrolase [Catalinimonas alkaloidigena]MDF9796996.1 amidohydrolase [Catalinimonas alkaloidigena]